MDEDISMHTFWICPICNDVIPEDNHYYIDWQEYELIEEFGIDGSAYQCDTCCHIVEPFSIQWYEYDEWRKDNPVRREQNG